MQRKTSSILVLICTLFILCALQSVYAGDLTENGSIFQNDPVGLEGIGLLTTISQSNWFTDTCTYTYSSGADDIGEVGLLFNTTSPIYLDGACFLYNQNTNKLYMVNESGDRIPTGGVTPDSDYVIETENAYLDCKSTSASASGNNLTVVWGIKLKPGMADKTLKVWLESKDTGGDVIMGWTQQGTISVTFSNIYPDTPIVSSPGTTTAGSYTTIPATYTDSNGRTDLWNCKMLINQTLTRIGGAYFVYSQNTNKLYMVGEDNVQIGGYAPGSANVIETENAYLDCAGTTVEPAALGSVPFTLGSDSLKVNFRVKFKAGMGGKTHNIYLYTDDDNKATTGWLDRGDLTIMSAFAPTADSVSPSSATINQTPWTDFTCTCTDLNGSSNLTQVRFLINTSITSSGGGYFVYNRSTNKLYMVRNNGTQIPASGVTRGGSYIIETENAYLDCKNCTSTPAGNSLAVKFRVKLKPNMAGKTLNLYLKAIDAGGLTSDWIKKGTVFATFTNSGPVTISVTPSSGMIATGTYTTLSAVYADGNGRSDLWNCKMLINQTPTRIGGAYFVYSQNTNKLYMVREDNAQIGGYAPGSANVIETENAYLDCAGTTVEPVIPGLVSDTLGSQKLQVNFRVKFKSSMESKTHNIYLSANDDSSATSGWADRGNITIAPIW
jgi:hypothetical protein